MTNSWRMVVGFGVAVRQGLDYTALRAVLEMNNVPTDQWPNVFRDVRLIESGALQQLATMR